MLCTISERYYEPFLRVNWPNNILNYWTTDILTVAVSLVLKGYEKRNVFLQNSSSLTTFTSVMYDIAVVKVDWRRMISLNVSLDKWRKKHNWAGAKDALYSAWESNARLCGVRFGHIKKKMWSDYREWFQRQIDAKWETRGYDLFCKT